MKKVFSILLAFVMVFSLCSCGEKAQVVEEEPTVFFDFTVSEFADALKNEYGANLTPIVPNIDADDGGKISTYTCSTGTKYDQGVNVHYTVCHDTTTNKVSSISFLFDKSARETEDNLTLYYLHIALIAEIIQPAVDVNEIYDAIINVDGADGENEGIDESAIYDADKFSLYASCSSSFFNAYFTPTF